MSLKNEVEELRKQVQELTSLLQKTPESAPVKTKLEPNAPDTFNPRGTVPAQTNAKRKIKGGDNTWQDNLTEATDLINKHDPVEKSYRHPPRQYEISCGVCRQKIKVEGFEYAYYNAHKDEDGSTTFVCHKCRG